MADGDRYLPINEPLAQRLKRRHGHLSRERSSWEPHWRELAQNFRPRSGNWDTAALTSRGQKKGQNIINSTPLIAARTLASGMMSGLTSPARPWFRLATPDPALSEFDPVKEWLFIVESRMREVFAKSNLYRVLPTMYAELGVFGVSAAPVLEDPEDFIRLQPWEIGTYWLANDSALRVDTGYREIRMTVRQVVQEFGIDRVSGRVKSMFKNGQWEQHIDVLQAIEPNDERLANAGGARGMRWRSVYWEKGGEPDKLLAERGFSENPLLAPRWIAEGQSVYGDSPAMDALGDAKGLQFEERRKAQSLDKLVDPPMIAPTSLRNDRVSLLPGDVTYVDMQQDGRGGYRPAYEIKPDIQWQAASIREIQDRINDAMYASLFLMLAQSDRRQITAREIEERHEEKLLQLGPVLERLNDELLDPLIDRTFAVLLRKSEPMWRGAVDGTPLIPPPPQELAGIDLKVEYISILAQAQKMVGLTAMDRYVQFAGAAAQTKAIADQAGTGMKTDWDQLHDVYADALGLPPKVVVGDDAVAEARAAAQQQQQMQQMAAMAGPVDQAASALKKASETQVGTGDSALDAMISAAGAAGGAP